MLDLAIIGGGPAGLTAGLYAARAGLSVELFEELFTGGQAGQTNIMENIILQTEGISGPDFAMKMTEQAMHWGVVIRYEQVKSLQLQGEVKKIVTAADTYEARCVLLSMGAKPRPLQLDVPGEERLTGRGVSYCATCDGTLYKGKSVAVVGGGTEALRDVVYLARLCDHVTLIHKDQTFEANQALQKAVGALSNVEILQPYVVRSIEGEQKVGGMIVQNRETDETRTLEVQGIFVAIGSEVNTALVRGILPLDENGFILTDEEMTTGVPGVFAAGDIRKKTLRQVITAAADGAIAAHSVQQYLTSHKS